MKIDVVGIGPGGGEFLTPQAREAILAADVVVGYAVYINLVKDLLAGKEVVANGMRREVERCRAALSEALKGKKVALVCSGDAGVYGMSGIMFEVAEGSPGVEINVVPGITAACSAAAALGAPLMHDFAVISLSDLLTPWEKIEKRLAVAAEADFAVCLYNPKSRGRSGHLAKAVDVLLRHKEAGTLCGYAKNTGREGEATDICRLDELPEQDIDMFTTVIIGNSQTKNIGGRLVTPRGYKSV